MHRRLAGLLDIEADRQGDSPLNSVLQHWQVEAVAEVERKLVGRLPELQVFLCLDPLMNGGMGRDYRAAAEGLGLAVLLCEPPELPSDTILEAGGHAARFLCLLRKEIRNGDTSRGGKGFPRGPLGKFWPQEY